MVLSIEDIKYYIEAPANKELLQVAAKQQKKAELHLTGKRLDHFFEKIDKVENDDYIELKKKLTNAISKPLFERILKPVNRIFSGQGGSISYNIAANSEIQGNEKLAALKSILQQPIAGGQSVKAFLRKTWAPVSIWANPFGIILIEETEARGEKHLNIKSIPVFGDHDFNIWDVSYKSFDYIEYLILYKGKRRLGKKDYSIFRVIDDEKDITVLQHKTKDSYEYFVITDFDLLIFEPIELVNFANFVHVNSFGRVPALFNSSRVSKEFSGLFVSYCYDSLEIADNHLNDFADYRIYKKKVGIPRMWEYVTNCQVCDGSGQIQIKAANKPIEVLRCNSCNGQGVHRERTLADIYTLELLDNDTQSNVPPFGVETMPVDIQDQMTKELSEMEVSLYETIWGQGTFMNEQNRDVTAFEVAKKSEDKLDRLKEIEENRAKVFERIINIIGSYLMPDSFEGAIVRPNTRFILLSATEAYQVYLEAKKHKAPSYQLNKLYLDYLESEYENDVLEYQKQLKLLYVNPSPHHEINEVANILTPVERTIKKNFERYIERFENSVNYISDPAVKIDILYAKLQEYANEDLETNVELNINDNDTGQE